ncbi:MAG TPA: DUF2254 domain-containing protein [Patescibacteria group bacterium]|nr:DUF2254 domain-containing protein [Patescibacteria group bacterium]
MKIRLFAIWESLHTSYWFVPTLMILAATATSFYTVSIDENTELDAIRSVTWLWKGGAEGARAMLSTIAGSVITVAGVVFSITITTLSFASSQFGPRLLRNFISDRTNQVVLGTFLSTFTYCILIMRTVRSSEELRFVPYVSVTVGLVLALASVGMLIFFIHHMANSIQAENLVAVVGRDLHKAIHKIFPEAMGKSGKDDSDSRQDKKADIPQDFIDNSYEIIAQRSGYIQAVEEEKLMELASTNNLILQLEYRPGHFVAEGMCLLRLWPKAQANAGICKEIRDLYLIGNHRTPVQDIEYAFHQLVEIALRALSPSLNDPYTAINCLDWLSAGLLQLAQRQMPSKYRLDKQNKLRIVTNITTFSGLADVTYNQIRQYGKASAAVTIRMLETIEHLAPQLHYADDRAALLKHAEKIYADLRESIHNKADRNEILERYHSAIKSVARKEDILG